MDQQRIDELTRVYRDGLLEDTVPFWLRHALDEEHGGYMTAVDRAGNVVDTDKAIWFQGRFAWLLSELCNVVGHRDEWLEPARSGIDFLRKHGFDADGRMFFQVTRDGQPLRKRRYVFSELFTVIAYAAFAKAASDQQACDEASSLFRSTIELLKSDSLESKTNPNTRPSRGFGAPMILLNTASIVRKCIGEEHENAAFCDSLIEDSIQQMRFFMNEEHEAVLEMASPKGTLIDHFDGRTLNPGHAIEGAWFVLNEAMHRSNDRELIEMGTRMLDWMWRWGWDEEHGGITYFCDVRGLPVQEYWHDMKFWWPQCEAIIATLIAWRLTGKQRYADWHRKIHDWTYDRFPDSDFGEWFGYLHRDGRVSNQSKGTLWKGPFHIPRMQLTSWKLLETPESK
ncbi:MAG: AGE family epimerase/isomerase [Planctomycetaceae bacterium]